ncbi:ClbS/DfsB family four-helix bundle protein [Helicobacter sp. UBA3407]|nr:ClbS/DfsB family four-helix bundle protein [Helicobacter sp. UBA3407]
MIELELIRNYKNDMTTLDNQFYQKYYPWCGTTSLGIYCVSRIASYYDWAIKLMKKYLKQRDLFEVN